METTFWLERWQNNEIGFHQDRVNPFLERYWPALELPHRSRVLVPLCGKSLDLLWLHAHGHRVTGVEISRLAIEAFFEEHGLTPEVRELGDCSRWTAGDIELYCADFFGLAAATLGHFDACYDRAALIALPGEMRRRYVQQLHALLPAPTPGLMITMDYPATEMQGPPFAVDSAELRRLFEAAGSLRLLETTDTLAASPGLRTRGLTRLEESVWQVNYQ